MRRLNSFCSGVSCAAACAGSSSLLLLSSSSLRARFLWLPSSVWRTSATCVWRRLGMKRSCALVFALTDGDAAGGVLAASGCSKRRRRPETVAGLRRIRLSGRCCCGVANLDGVTKDVGAKCDPRTPRRGGVLGGSCAREPSIEEGLFL